MNIEERWEKGIAHKPEADKLIRLIKKMDCSMNDGRLDIRCGGDGDIGEDLM